MGVGNQIDPFCKRMRITQKFLAELIEESPSTLTNWKSGFTPDTNQLNRLVDVTGASADWWLGRRTLTMWGLDLIELQDKLHAEASHIEAADLVDRSVKVIKFMQDNEAHCREDWYMAGLLGLPVSEMKRLITELPENFSPITLKNLAEITGLHPDWLMDGDESALSRQHNSGDYSAFIRQCSEDGIMPQELISNYDWFLRKILQQRRLSPE